MFLQHTQNSHLAHLARKHKIINYVRYVDDTFFIFSPNYTNIQAILNDFNAIHPKLHFTAEIEQNNILNYLDISNHKTPTNTETFIQRKHTFSDTIVPYTSNHPTQHKYAVIKFLYNRLNTCLLPKKGYQQEENIIHNILYNNSFPIQPQKAPSLNPNQQQISPTHKHRWATFTSVGKETTYITHIQALIAYHTNNKIQNHLIYKNRNPDKFSLSGVHKLTCPDCKKAYVGQTERNFTIRYNEHRHTFCNNSHSSKITQHLNEHVHSFRTINDTSTQQNAFIFI